MYLIILSLIALSQYAKSVEVIYSRYTLTFSENNCRRGQTLKVYETDKTKAVPICNKLNKQNLRFICNKNDKCLGNAGVATYTDKVSDKELILENDNKTLGFVTDASCTNSVLCFDKQSSCVLPTIQHGGYNTSSGFNSQLLYKDHHVILSCHVGYTWYWSNVISCIQMSDSSLQLTSEPKCVELRNDHKMGIRVNVPRTHDTTTLLNGQYTKCFETSILSLFLMGMESTPSNTTDLFSDYSLKPKKRETAIGLLRVKIHSLDIVSKKDDQPYGILIGFYIFQYQKPLSPGLITKVMENVPRNKYDLVLESYCQLIHCTGRLDPGCKNKVPSMQFSGLPRPTEKCLYKSKKLDYGAPVPLLCHKNEYIQEKEITRCLFHQTYYPALQPNCSECGSRIYKHVKQFKGPVRSNGNNARGAKCTWQIDLDNDIIGQFYLESIGDKSTCKNSEIISYLKITEYDPSSWDNVTKVRNKICFGNPMRLSRKTKIEFISNNISESEKGFTFYYEDNLPMQPWYKKYSAILIAAPLIVVFFISLVLLGVYCDNKNRKNSKVVELEVDISRDLETGSHPIDDQISNGTYKPVKDKSILYHNAVVDEAPITPQPRINNAVSGSEKKKRRRRKKRSSPNKTNTEIPTPVMEEEEQLKSPSLGTWVTPEPEDTRGADTPHFRAPTTRGADTSPFRASDTRGANTSPFRASDTSLSPDPPHTDSNITVLQDLKTAHCPTSDQKPTQEETEVTKALITTAKRKKRRKKKPSSVAATTHTVAKTPTAATAPLSDVRPLPPLNGSVSLSRPLPPIDNQNVNYLHIPGDLGID